MLKETDAAGVAGGVLSCDCAWLRMCVQHVGGVRVVWRGRRDVCYVPDLLGGDELPAPASTLAEACIRQQVWRAGSHTQIACTRRQYTMLSTALMRQMYAMQALAQIAKPRRKHILAVRQTLLGQSRQMIERIQDGKNLNAGMHAASHR